jgi:hypothetical protein
LDAPDTLLKANLRTLFTEVYLNGLPGSNLGYTPDPPKRAWWKWSLALTTLLLIFLMWQCGSALRQGRVLADPAVQEFHKKLNAGQYEEIYREADEGLAEEAKHDELVKFLEGVHARLGDAGITSQLNMRVNATTFGNSVVAQYNTTFARGSAVETFTWTKKGGTLKLLGYHIESNAFVVN